MMSSEANRWRSVGIAPSILSADFAALGVAVRDMTAAGADAVHVDVMDGHFVPNLTIGPAVVAALRPHSPLPFETHLMIEPVDPFVRDFAAAGSDLIIFHVEAGCHAYRTLQLIKEEGKRAGISLCPATPAAAIAELIPFLDHVLVMTVEPGFGGQSFIPEMLTKVAAIRAMIDESGRPIDLEVDGGVNVDTAPLLIDAGVDLLVAGTASFVGGPSCYAENIRRLRGVA